MTTWYLRREYEFSLNGNVYKTSNEVQEIECPGRKKRVHGQYTHSWKNRDFPEEHFKEVNYHYNLGPSLEAIESLAFFYIGGGDPPKAGVFPAGEKVFYLALGMLPQKLHARWPSHLRAGEIAQYGNLVGRQTSERPLR